MSDNVVTDEIVEAIVESREMLRLGGKGVGKSLQEKLKWLEAFATFLKSDKGKLRNKEIETFLKSDKEKLRTKAIEAFLKSDTGKLRTKEIAETTTGRIAALAEDAKRIGLPVCPVCQEYFWSEKRMHDHMRASTAAEKAATEKTAVDEAATANQRCRRIRMIRGAERFRPAL